MSQSVSEELEDTRSHLHKKLAANEDLANVLMALLGKIVINYRSSPKLEFTAPQGNEQGVFTARIIPHSTTLTVPSRIIIKNDLGDYMASKNIALSKALQSKEVADFFQMLIQRIEQFAEHKHIPFPDLKVVQGSAFISNDHEFHLQVGKESFVGKIKRFIG